MKILPLLARLEGTGEFMTPIYSTDDGTLAVSARKLSFDISNMSLPGHAWSVNEFGSRCEVNHGTEVFTLLDPGQKPPEQRTLPAKDVLAIADYTIDELLIGASLYKVKNAYAAVYKKLDQAMLACAFYFPAVVAALVGTSPDLTKEALLARARAEQLSDMSFIHTEPYVVIGWDMTGSPRLRVAVMAKFFDAIKAV